LEPPETTTTVAPGELVVSGTATDAVDVSVTYGQQIAKVKRDGDTWRATVVVSIGECRVTVTACNALGNPAEQSRTLRGEAVKAAEASRTPRVDAVSSVSAWAEPVPGAKTMVIDGITYPCLVVEKQTAMRMVLVAACPGGFNMGSPANEPKRNSDEKQHLRKIGNGFWLGETEVTQAQYQKVMGANPSRFQGDNLPVERVSWEDCQQFVAKLNAQGGGFRLPSEAEWEYACRAGNASAFNTGNDIDTNNANYDGSLPYGVAKGVFRECTVPAGSLPANALGFREMHGNVREMCQDAYDTYSDTGDERAVGGAPQALRVVRGGYWGAAAQECRSASRAPVRPNERLSHTGFRLARALR
jgi:formylglycine-generating enzyme required for sulfatase activity